MLEGSGGPAPQGTAGRMGPERRPGGGQRLPEGSGGLAPQGTGGRMGPGGDLGRTGHTVPDAWG